jgi:hypothetical protein
MKSDHLKYEPLEQELMKSAMHEIDDLVKEYKLYLDEYVQTTRAARVASMLRTEGQWPAIVRQQNALERLLERKIRLLMELQEHRTCSAPRHPGRHPARPCRVAPTQRVIQPSPEGRVARDGAFSSRRGSGEGSLASYPRPTQKAENSGNELSDLLQSNGLTPSDPSK